MGHVGANIPCIPPADRPYTDAEYYDPFWRVAEELEMPMVMHVNCSAQPNHGLPNWGPVRDELPPLADAAWRRSSANSIWSGVAARFLS